jgi:integrase
MRWTQVDLTERVVRLNPGTTKNEQGRVLPLTRELFQLLAIQKQLRDAKYPECDWVFFRNGRQIRSYRKAWETACKTVGLAGLIFHDLRRTGVRNLRRAGVTETVAMKISGHKTRSIFDRYNIVDEQDLKEAAQKLDAFLKNRHNSVTIPPSDQIPLERKPTTSRVN